MIDWNHRPPGLVKNDVTETRKPLTLLDLFTLLDLDPTDHTDACDIGIVREILDRHPTIWVDDVW